MSVKILVPFKDVSQAVGSSLIIDHPDRCSRCGKKPADYFESHRLKLRAGQKKPGLYRVKYVYSKPYTLKIRVCEDCYQTDFLTYPDLFDRDPTPLGRAARLYSVGYMIGAIVAAIGLLFLSELLPDMGLDVDLASYWKIPAAAGLAIIGIIWLLQKQQQKKVRESLAAKNIDPSLLKRAEVYTPVIDSPNELNAISLRIGINDETWAEECARHYHWNCESYEPGTNRGEE